MSQDKPRVEALIDKAMVQDYILAPSEVRELVELVKYYRRLASNTAYHKARTIDE